MRGPESKVESHLRDEVRRAGGICIKNAPTIAGVPDRMVLLAGRVHLVELKAPGGRLRPIQVVFIERAAKIGIEVAVLDSIQAVDGWIDGLTQSQTS